MKQRRFFLPVLLALALLFTSCSGKSQAYEPPEWLAGFNFAEESARVMRLVAESGADDASLAELKTLFDRTNQLPYYYFSSTYTGPNREVLNDHARTARMFFEMMLETQNNAWNWADVAAQTETYLTALQASDAPDADQSWLPRFERTPDADPYYSVLACFFRAKRASEQKNNIISITVGGDTTFGQRAGADPKLSFDAEFSRHDGDLAYPLRLMAPYFRNDSLTLLNCAGTFTNATEARDEGALRGSPGYAGMFSAGGVDAVNIANEHTLDYFDVGLRDTQANLAAANVAYFGGATTLVQEADGVKFGFLGYDVASGIPEDLEALLGRDIAAVRDQGAQLVLVLFHWGGAATAEPSAEQIAAAHLAVDLGADLVVGQHPKALQGMEIYNGKTIAYSLNTFLRGGETALSDKGSATLLRQPFQKNDDGTFTPLMPMLLPSLASSADPETANNYAPRPAFGDTSGHVVRLVFKYSRPLEYGVKELASVG